MKWMKKLWKKEIDERQQADLNRVLGFGYWIAFYLLLAAVIVEGVFLSRPFSEWAAEWIIFMVIAVYEVIASFRIGVWTETKQNPGKKDYVRYSLIGSVLFSIIFTFGNVLKMNPEKRVFGNIAPIFVYWFLLLFVVMLISFLISGNYFHKRRRKMEEELDKESMEDDDE